MSSQTIEELDFETLKRLDLPRTSESKLGLDRLWLQKLVNLVYDINNIWTAPHKQDVRAPADVTASGALFTAPIDARRVIFSMRLRYSATATAGSRTVQVVKLNTAGDYFDLYLSRSITANGSEFYDFHPASQTSDNLNVQLSYPIHLEPQWSIRIDDTNNIDNLDDVGWVIDYLEVPI